MSLHYLLPMLLLTLDVPPDPSGPSGAEENPERHGNDAIKLSTQALPLTFYNPPI